MGAAGPLEEIFSLPKKINLVNPEVPNHNNSLNNQNIHNSTNSLNQIKNSDLKMIWIDYNIDNKENKEYSRLLNEDVSLIKCKTIEQGLNEIKKIKFERVILMLSKTTFDNFITSFEHEKNNICCSLNIIIFTQKIRKSLIEEICDNNKEISAGYIFDKVNIFDNFLQILNFIKKEKSEKKKVFTPHFEIINDINKKYYNEKDGCFEKIENYEELILPIYFHKIMENITLEEIHNFNYYLSTSFTEAKNILSQFDDLPKMPIEILCKYWAKIYTFEKGEFYSILNEGLRSKNYKLFLPFIKMMYEGVKKKVFTSITNEPLYSGGAISNKELEELRNNLNNNINNNLPKFIYYFKSFKSFSKKKEKAKSFMKNPGNDSTRLLFIVDTSHIEEEFVSNAYIKDFSEFKDEDEVLFFPFSSFEVYKIENKENYVNIYLKYLGRYKSIIEENKPKDLIFQDIPISQFGREINEMGLINYKFSKFWEVKKEISFNGNVNCLLVFNKKVILVGIGSNLILYRNNIMNNNKNNIININIHQGEINDLLKINETLFVSSSNDKTIKFVQLSPNNYSNYKVIKSIAIHHKKVYQTIKLKQDYFFASCSGDKSIKLWKYDFRSDKNIVSLKNTCEPDTKIISLCELPESNIVSMSKNGYLIFFKFNNSVYEIERIIKGFKNYLKNCLYLIDEKYVLVGTKNSVVFIDINTKEKIKKFFLDFNAYSICYFNKKIFLGLKNNRKTTLLYEYEYRNENKEIKLECIGKGCDLCLKIPYIYAITERTIVTSNINNSIKIWKVTEEKPKSLFYKFNPFYYLEEDYNSEIDLGEDITPGNENEIIIGEKETSKTEEMTPIGEKETPKGEVETSKGEIETPKGDDQIKINETPGKEIKINENIKENNFINKEINNKNNFNMNINIKSNNNFNKPMPEQSNSKLNIIFKSSTGIKIILACEKDITVEQLIKLFFERFNYNNIDERIVFMHNANHLNINDKTKIKDKFDNNATIIVIDALNVLNITNHINLKTAKGIEYNVLIPSSGNLGDLLKIYFNKIGKPIEDNKIKFLKEINFEDFIIKLSGSNE